MLSFVWGRVAARSEVRAIDAARPCRNSLPRGPLPTHPAPSIINYQIISLQVDFGLQGGGLGRRQGRRRPHRRHRRRSQRAHSCATPSPQVSLAKHPRIEFLHNPQEDPQDFCSLPDLARHVRQAGYYGGVRLLLVSAAGWRLAPAVVHRANRSGFPAPAAAPRCASRPPTRRCAGGLQ